MPVNTVHPLTTLVRCMTGQTSGRCTTQLANMRASTQNLSNSQPTCLEVFFFSKYDGRRLLVLSFNVGVAWAMPRVAISVTRRGLLHRATGRLRREGSIRAELRKERDGGNSLPATTASRSIRQPHRTTFCTLKRTRSSYKTAHLFGQRVTASRFFGSASGERLGSCGWRRYG